MNDNSSCLAGIVCIASIIALFILAICFGVSWQKWNDRTVVVECPITGEGFTVQNNKTEPDWVRKEVARRIGSLASKVDRLVLYMYNKKLPDAKISERLATRWKKIRLNPHGLRETSFGESSAAYTVNKGDQMRICIRDEKSDNLFEDENTGFFVMLHELAHLMSKSYGHNLEFKRNFAYITKVAVELGLYKYQDFTANPETYCGTDITNPSY